MTRSVCSNRRHAAPGAGPAAMAGALAVVAGTGPARTRPDAGTAGGDADRYVCPFCGETYARSRPRCGSCGGLPVVPREDRSVYETVVGQCGPNCEAGALGTARPPAGRGPAVGPADG